jgi:hypothetical protein
VVTFVFDAQTAPPKQAALVSVKGITAELGCTTHKPAVLFMKEQPVKVLGGLWPIFPLGEVKIAPPAATPWAAVDDLWAKLLLKIQSSK